VTRDRLTADEARSAGARRDAANRRLAKWLALVAAGFFAFGLALVPLYNSFCELTGLNGRTADAGAAFAATPRDAARSVKIELTSMVMPGLPWRFEPEQASLRVRPGEPATAVYVATNLDDRPREGQAVMSVSPQLAATHFRKIECFCYTRQALRPGEARRMPVMFVVAPDLPDDVRTLTLSYSFFPVDGRRL